MNGRRPSEHLQQASIGGRRADRRGGGTPSATAVKTQTVHTSELASETRDLVRMELFTSPNGVFTRQSGRCRGGKADPSARRRPPQIQAQTRSCLMTRNEDAILISLLPRQRGDDSECE